MFSTLLFLFREYTVNTTKAARYTLSGKFCITQSTLTYESNRICIKILNRDKILVKALSYLLDPSKVVVSKYDINIILKNLSRIKLFLIFLKN